MSCGSDFHTSNCVCDTLLCILEAQEKVAPSEDNDCEFGCKSSIDQLLSPTQTGNDTIPVILVCKSTCAPFVGVGVRTTPGTANLETVCGCVFRVVDVDPDTCCATLEILVPETTDTDLACDLDAEMCIAELDGSANTFTRTRTCITVDLNCFCGVTCLPPTNLL